jgi:ubiquinone/menaquinone biosynthesis C-methylase UbiE
LIFTDYPADGLPEYADAEEYDQVNVWGPSDDFYLTLAMEIGGPVLDVGCGTGGLARAIAGAGLDVTGLDITTAMLERAGSLSQDLDIEWIHGDARTMQLGRTFRLTLMTGHAFQHMLTDQDIDAFLARMHEHLREDGYLAFETRNYAANNFSTEPEPQLWKSYQDAQGRWIDAYFGGRYDPDTGIEYLTGEDVVRETGERTQDTTTLRYIPVEQLNERLRRHGFEVVQQYGDWEKGPLGPKQREIITICRPAG